MGKELSLGNSSFKKKPTLSSFENDLYGKQKKILTLTKDDFVLDEFDSFYVYKGTPKLDLSDFEISLFLKSFDDEILECNLTKEDFTEFIPGIYDVADLDIEFIISNGKTLNSDENNYYFINENCFYIAFEKPTYEDYKNIEVKFPIYENEKPTNDNDLVNKKYVDNLGNELYAEIERKCFLEANKDDFVLITNNESDTPNVYEYKIPKVDWLNTEEDVNKLGYYMFDLVGEVETERTEDDAPLVVVITLFDIFVCNICNAEYLVISNGFNGVTNEPDDYLHIYIVQDMLDSFSKFNFKLFKIERRQPTEDNDLATVKYVKENGGSKLTPIPVECMYDIEQTCLHIKDRKIINDMVNNGGGSIHCLLYKDKSTPNNIIDSEIIFTNVPLSSDANCLESSKITYPNSLLGYNIVHMDGERMIVTELHKNQISPMGLVSNENDYNYFILIYMVRNSSIQQMENQENQVELVSIEEPEISAYDMVYDELYNNYTTEKLDYRTILNIFVEPKQIFGEKSLVTMVVDH